MPAKAATKPKTEDRKPLIDELGALEAELASEELATKVKRVEALRKVVRAWADADSVPADKSILYSGSTFTVTVGMRRNQRRITALKAIFREVGQAKFLDACGLTLEALKTLVGEEKVALYTTEERTGSRDLHSFRNAA